ncbi:MAG: sugar ABC transporter permease [Spirochaetales bacterium]|nr:sugar ABC transporter permease [Spirochaetales bacterium]
MKTQTKKMQLAPYLFVSPFLILFLIFFAFPALFTIVISVSDWKEVGQINFRGWDNHINLFLSDSNFPPAVIATVFILVFGFLPQHMIALPLAITINNGRLKGRTIFEAMFLFPYLSNTVVIGLLMSYLFNSGSGWVIILLGYLGVEKIDFYELLTPIIMLSIIINRKYIGFNILLYLAGLASISKELYEAADIAFLNRQVEKHLTHEEKDK